MKIDTSSSLRLPVGRLKHPVKQKTSILPSDVEVDEQKMSVFSEDFERGIVRSGAQRFKAWLEKCELNNLFGVCLIFNDYFLLLPNPPKPALPAQNSAL